MIPMTSFGRTGIAIPRIGLGLAALGRPGYINLGHSEDLASNYVVEAMEGRTHRMLDLAWSQGIRYFDAARSYGCAEDFLRTWLEQSHHALEEIVIGSKWGYTYTADWQVDAEQHEVKDHSVANLRRQWAESECLRPHLKLYQIHSATLDTGVLENAEVLNTLREIKEQGLWIGLSISGANQDEVLDKALGVKLDGEPLFDSAQITFNILEQSIRSTAEAAAGQGLGLLIKEALANGRLTGRNDAPEFRERKNHIQSLAEKYHCGMDAIAIAFVLDQPWAHVVLSGAATEQHLLSNIEAARIPMAREELDALTGLVQEKDAYWADRAVLPWN